MKVLYNQFKYFALPSKQIPRSNAITVKCAEKNPFQKLLRNLEKMNNNDANRNVDAIFLNDYF